MIKPPKLNKGDTVAAVSPSWGCAGAPRVIWQYRLGCARLNELGLEVVAAPNSLRGTAYLKNNPEARADDLMWAFENKNVKAVIANIGGNDSVRLLPYLKPEPFIENPKIFCGYSDIMTIHLYLWRLGLSTFYGDNLLTSIAENGRWHPYSRRWFVKTFFDASPLGTIEPSDEWSFSAGSRTDRAFLKTYVPNPGCQYVQGRGRVSGKLFGGHADIRTLRAPDGSALVERKDFEGSILFFEDIPELCDVEYLTVFLDWLGQSGFLEAIRGMIIGKLRSPDSFAPFAECIRSIVSDKYGRPDLPVMSGLNFGHSSPTFILPYGAEAELDIDAFEFSISESGVV